jgi:hypothetical protein
MLALVANTSETTNSTPGQEWVLAGVVVGALLAGGAQIFADWIRARRDKKHRLGELRREAYTNFIAAAQFAVSSRREPPAVMIEKVVDPGGNISTEAALGWMESLDKNMVDLNIAQAAIKLAGPSEAAEAAGKVKSVVVANTDVDPTLKKGKFQFHQTLDDFVTLAQPFADIEITKS